MLARPTRSGRFSSVRRTGGTALDGGRSAMAGGRGGHNRSSNHMAGLRGTGTIYPTGARAKTG